MKKSFLLAFGLLSMGAFAQNTPWSTTGNIGIGTTSSNFNLEVATTSTPTNFYDLAFIGSKVTSTFPRNSISYNGLIFRKLDSGMQLGYAGYAYTSGLSPLLQGQITFIPSPPLTINSAAISLGFGTGNVVKITQNGKVRISTTDIATPNGYRLFVEDGILTEKVRVAVEGTADWADYVFADNYNLMPLNEVEAFTKENKHLPNVPSAEDVVNQGLDVAQMDAKLLEKIEELTLYLIEQNKQIEELKAEIKELKEQDKE